MIRAPLSFTEAIKQYDRRADFDKVERAEQQRAEVLRRFPPSHWPDMTLDEYALGQEGFPENFCRFMEFQTIDLGDIRGGSAHKHVIYKHKRKHGWYFPKTFTDEQTAWTRLRAQFVQALEHAKMGQWAEIDGLDLLSRCRTLCLKSLHLYFPDDVLPIYSDKHLEHFLDLLDQSVGNISRHGSVKANQRLLHVLRAQPEVAGWTTMELQLLLYRWSDPRTASQVVKIAPGRQAKYWEECLKGGYICVGWDDVGDLRQFESKESYRAKFFQAFLERSYSGHRSTAVRKSNELWMLRELEPGDFVVANQGISKILGVGRVIEPGYEWRDDRQTYKHTVAVEWDSQYEGTIPAQKYWANVTLKRVPPALFHKIASIRREGSSDRPEPVAVDPLYRRIADALDRKGQLILYGPPGTGKTYTARRFATWWLLRESDAAAADSVLGDSESMARHEMELSTAQVVRRVWWAVAEPTRWSWDHHSRGGRVTLRRGRFRRNFPLVQCGDLLICYQSGPDNKIASLARVSRELRFDHAEKWTIELEGVTRLENGVTYTELLADPVLARAEPVRLRCQGTLFALSAYESEYLFSLLNERNPGVSLGDEPTEGDIRRLTRLTFHPSYSYEDFIEGFRPSEQGGGGLSLRLEDGIFKRVCRAAQARPDRRFLILVDEINRGNVAKILGELLTLLERDKRGLTLLLPQSKETFSIPPNVYLLGTMNTADRSIKLLDAALRRRFAFLELMPEVELLSGAIVGDLTLDGFLEELNRRVAQSEGREKQIGHAYLLEDGEPVTDVESFARCFREDILPLLQEYCYDEYGTLAKYIGSRLVDAETQQLAFDKVADAEELVAALAEEFDGETQSGAE